MKLTSTIYLLALVLAKISFATTVITPAQSTSHGLAASLGYYAADHEGAIPSDLLALFGKELNRLELFEKQIGAKVAERFHFLNQHQVNDEASGRVIIITRDRVSDDRRDAPGRYVVWLKDGVFQSSWETEERMQAVFKQAGQTLESGGVWVQPPAKYIDHPPVVSGTEPESPPKSRASSNPSLDSPPQVKQPSIPKLATQPAAVPYPESKSWLVWLLVVIAATGGAVWLFLRKSKP